MFAVLPFGNRTVIETLTGAQLEQAFLNGFSPFCNAGDRDGPLPADLRAEGARSPATARRRWSTACGRRRTGIGGPLTPIGPADTVRFVTNDFMYTGGDGYTVFTQGTNVLQPGDDLLQVAIDYVTANSPVGSGGRRPHRRPVTEHTRGGGRAPASPLERPPSATRRPLSSVHACDRAPRDVQLGRRRAPQGLVSARRVDGRSATALLRRAVRRRRGRLAVLRAARPGRDAALGRAHARSLHLPRQGRRRDDLPRGRADRRGVRGLPWLRRAARAVGEAARRPAPVPPALRQVGGGQAGARPRARAARAARAADRVPPPLLDGAGRALATRSGSSRSRGSPTSRSTLR